MKEIARVAVIGAGTMGRQIALQVAQSGLPVLLFDMDAQALMWGGAYQRDRVAKQVAAGELTQDDAEAIFVRLHYATDLAAAVREADLVIEAIPERLDLKRPLWTRLDELTPPGAILATNSSSIRVSLLEESTARPTQVANLHFFHPLRDRRMVEIGPGTMTSDATMDALADFARRIGVLPLRVRKESTGFIINRVWRAIKKETLRVADSGVGSFEDVDRAFMIFFGVPQGPFGLMDEIGLDVVKDIEEHYAAESGNPADLPPAILTERVARGDLGVKTQKGFYTYPDPAYASPDFLKPDAASEE